MIKADYVIENILGEMGKRISQLITDGVFQNKKVLIYGLDTISMGIHSILSNHDIQIEGYICDDERAVRRIRRSMKGFASRYLSSRHDLAGAWTLSERLGKREDDIVILSGSKDMEIVCDKLASFGYEDNKNLYQLFNWKTDIFLERVSEEKALTIRDTQDVLKDILYTVDSYCVKSGIDYWVCGGTLLGTIRHKGFIPWDDDVDILLKWDDYCRILTDFPESDRYKIMGMTKTPRNECYIPFGKILDKRTIVRESTNIMRFTHPVSLDIFPLVGIPSDPVERNEFFEDYKEAEYSIWENYYALDADLIAYENNYKEQISFFNRYNVDEADYVGVLGTAYGSRDFTRKEVYSDTLRMPFEDIEVNVPVGYREYLDNLYGKGWMELPPESEQFSHHGAQAYWL